MAEIDGSIPANANAPKPNPLGMVSDIVGIRNALLQGKQQQQSLQIGGQTIRSNELNISSQQYELGQKHLQGLSTFFSRLYARDNLTKEDIIQATADGINMGLFTSKEAQAELGSMPDDNAGIHDHIRQLIFSTADQGTRLQAIAPAPTMVPRGTVSSPMRLPQIGQPSFAGPDVPIGVSPETAANPQATVRTNASGQPVSGTAPYGTMLPPAAVQPGGNPYGVMGGAPQSPAQPQPSGMGVPPTNASSGYFNPTSAPMGSSTLIGGRAQQTVDADRALRAAADAVPMQRASLNNLDSLVDKFKSGEGSDFARIGKNFVNTNSPFGNLFDPKSIAAQEDFNKQATMLSAQQMAQLGLSNTNAQVDMTSHLSPNERLTRMGNHEIIAVLKGNADAIQAKNAAWQEYYGQHKTDADYNTWSTQFNRTFDPRVFQSQHLSKDQRGALIAHMSRDERDTYLDNYAYAIDQGWVKDPRKK